MSCASPCFWLVFFGEVGVFSFLLWFSCLNQTFLDVVDGLRCRFVASFGGLDFHLTFLARLKSFFMQTLASLSS